ncbi:MAG: [FeFe] hydrogenase, group A [Candidatus Omnitrophica bacterium]|nr:[FeFe] hydrogenase, group A [Candidatus Omnitrophota bacterium]
MRISINGAGVEISAGTAILEAIRMSGTQLREPDLGGMKDFIFNPVCPLRGVAEVDGELCPLVFLSSRPVRENMVIVTQSERINAHVEERAKLMREQRECYFMKQWQKMLLAEAESAGRVTREEWERFSFAARGSEPSIYHDPNKCVRCKACVEVCRDIQTVEALRFDEKEGVVFDESRCVRCGQCIHHCPMGATAKFKVITDMLGCSDCAFARPLGAMREVDDVMKVMTALKDSQSYCIVQFAPAVRASIGEEFGMPDGELVTKKLYAALRRAGFKKVWDTNFAADLTIMEEGMEFIERVKNSGPLPQFTSCSPGWIRFVETFFPGLLPNISTAKSPQQMFGAVAKTFGAKNLGIAPEKMKVISIMPCTAKKSECSRPEMNSAYKYWKSENQNACEHNFQDVDFVLTTRELAKLFKMLGIDLRKMPAEEADPLLGDYTGAAPIFGRTGGVMEAALRTVVTVLTGKPPVSLEFKDLGSMDGIKRAALKVGDLTVKVAVAHGLKNARTVCESVLSGGEFAQYHFIEIMTCPGGCIGGGGQPIPTNEETKTTRTCGLNRDDHEVCALRMSHENPEVKGLYESFLGKPLSHISHELLHTTYTVRTGA